MILNTYTARQKWLMMLFTFPMSLVFSASHHPQDFLKRIEGTKEEGAQIVQHYCANCHASKPIISLGAPRIGNKADWEPRLKQGIDVLFHHTDEGMNQMPARGGCFECEDRQLLLAIEVMIKSIEP